LTTLFVLAWLLLLAAPAILSSEGVPHSLRMIGMLPVGLRAAGAGDGVGGARARRVRLAAGCCAGCRCPSC
jgi:hypothetical protein